MLRKQLGVAVIFMALLALQVAHRDGYGLHVYGWPGQTANGGIVVDIPNDWYGLEMWGAPGFFHHVD